MAQADRGAGPNPVMLNASTRMNVRRTMTQSNMQLFVTAAEFSTFFLTKGCDVYHLCMQTLKAAEPVQTLSRFLPSDHVVPADFANLAEASRWRA